ncbi:type IV secretory system conjugative DNA transfer family protein, partial [Roseiflexus castenholzii]|uniref:type IV secretory system conjugative DNA transfer family protein n=1 Tax=Roseiflexus castenholzii TaxID=120962 RepID=UPI003C7E084C
MESIISDLGRSAWFWLSVVVGGLIGVLVGTGVVVIPDMLMRWRNDGIRIRWGDLPKAWLRPIPQNGLDQRLTIGEYRRWWGLSRRLVSIPPQHALIIAPSGGGKSTTLMSAMMTWGGGLLCLDPKGEFFDVTAGWRALNGHTVLRWDVRSGRSDHGVGGLPIERLYGGRDQALEELVKLMIGDDHKQRPFVLPWLSIIRAFMADADRKGEPPWSAATAIPSSQWEARLKEIAKTPQHPGRLDAEQALGVAPAQEYFASIAGTADQALPTLRVLARQLDAGSGMDVPDLTRTSIYLILPTNPLPGELIAIRWILSGVAAYVVRGEPLPSPGAVWIIDEAGALRPDGLPDWIRFMRGRGISVMIATQSVSDLDDAYGRERAASIIGAMNGPHYFMSWRTLSGSTIDPLAQAVANRAWVRRGKKDRREDRPATIDDARRAMARMHHGILFPKTGYDAPAPVYAAPYFRYPIFRKRANLPIPTHQTNDPETHGPSAQNPPAMPNLSAQNPPA